MITRNLGGWKREKCDMDCQIYAEEIASAFTVMLEARDSMKRYQIGDKTPPEKRRLTQLAASLVIAADVLQMNEQHRFARLCGKMIKRVGRLAHS